MNVIHLSCVAPPETGGIGMVAWREVAGLRARGVDAELIAPEPRGGVDAESERRFVTRLVPRWRIGNASALPLDVDVLRRADVLHLHWPFYGTAEPLLRQAKALPPIVVTFHMDAKAGGPKGWAFAWHRFWFQSSLLASSAKILVSSFDYARHSSIASTFAKHPERVIELPFGVDTDLFSPGPSVRARLYVPEGVPVVAFVGGMDAAHAFKGIPELLQALALLPKVHALLVGDGDLRPSFEAQARALGLANRVHFLGKVDDKTKVDVLRSSDVLAFPSKHGAEAFGLVALEAEACGLPVVASDLPGVRTVVLQGKTGWLVKPGDVHALAAALGQATEDHALRLNMGTAAREYAVTRFSLDRHLDGLMEVYRSVCASRS